jgi:hypothetical protein
LGQNKEITQSMRLCRKKMENAMNMIPLSSVDLTDRSSELFQHGLQSVQDWSGHAVSVFKQIPQVFAERPNALIAVIVAANTLFLLILSRGMDRFEQRDEEGKLSFKAVAATEAAGLAAVCVFNMVISRATQAQLKLQTIVAIGLSSLVVRSLSKLITSIVVRNRQNDSGKQEAKNLSDEVLDDAPKTTESAASVTSQNKSNGPSSPEKTEREFLVLERSLADSRILCLDLTEQNEQLEKQYETEKKAHQAAQRQFAADQKQLTADLDSAKALVQKLQADLSKAKKDHQSEKEKLETEKKTVQDRISSLYVENDDLKQKSKQARDQLDGAEKARSQVEKERDAAIKEKEDTKKKNGQLIMKSQKLEAEKDLLHAKILELNIKIENLKLKDNPVGVTPQGSPVPAQGSPPTTRQRRGSDPSNLDSPLKQAQKKDTPSRYGNKYLF